LLIDLDSLPMHMPKKQAPTDAQGLDNEDSDSPLSAAPSSAEKSSSSAEKSDRKPRAEKAKGGKKPEKRPAADPETRDGSEPQPKRARRNKASVDYKEKTVKNL